MKQGYRVTAGVLGIALLLPLGLAVPAEAGSKGRRNTAIGLGAVAVYGIVKKKPLVAGVAGGGAIYSYMSSRKAAKKERQRAEARRRARAAGRYSTRYRTVRR